VKPNTSNTPKVTRETLKQVSLGEMEKTAEVPPVTKAVGKLP